MNVAQKHAFAEAAALLSGQGDLRVWSIIVTIFGDMAQDAGDEISGAAISAITELMGIKPAAMRVALHRLRKDGWIESVRDGRISRYHLSDHGRAESASASGKIYGDRTSTATDWRLVVLPPLNHDERSRAERKLLALDYAPIAPAIFLGSRPFEGLGLDPFALDVRWDSVPGWLKSALASQELTEAYDLLCERLETVGDLLKHEIPSSPLEIVTLRTLIVHHWRRLVLRHPELPAQFYPDDWPGERCRGLVENLLASLPRPQLDALEMHIAEAK